MTSPQSNRSAPASPTPRSARGEPVVVALLLAIGLLDVATGGVLLLSPSPWQAHGPGTPWQLAPKILATSPEIAPLVLSLFRRVGAFSLHAGVITIVAALLGRADRRVLGVVLVTYSVTGAAFFLTDHAFFAGTPYFYAKQAIATLWTVALVVHFWPRKQPKAPTG